MSDVLTVAALGFLLGLRHATDADHVVAVTTIVAREPRLGRAAAVGGVWGIGHSLTLLVVGGAIVAFRLTVPPRLGLGLEFVVALMLILLGFANLRAGRGSPASDGHVHASPAEPHAHWPRRTGAWAWRPFAIGTVHGLAGSAAVALLVLATIRSTAQALACLAVFGIGTVAGMALVTALVGASAALAGTRVRRLERGIRLAAGALSLGFGVLLADGIVRGDGLFSAAPHWSPR